MAMRIDSRSMVSPWDTQLHQVYSSVYRNAARTGMRPIIPTSRVVTDSQIASAKVPKRTYEPDVNEYFVSLVSLSEILGRILGAIYGPEGVKNTSDEEILRIAEDLKTWKRELPSRLKVTGAWSSLPAGRSFHSGS